MNRVIKCFLISLYLLFIFIFLYIIINYLRALLVSIFIAYILHPVVKNIDKRIKNYKVSVFITLTLFIFLIIIIIYYLFPIITKELIELINNADDISNEIKRLFGIIDKIKVPIYLRSILDDTILKIQDRVFNEMRNLFDNILKFISSLPTYILIPVFVYYFLVDTEYFKRSLKSLIPYKGREKVIELFRSYEKIVGNFIKGQIILSIIITIFTMIVLIILKVRYAFLISVVNGFFNIIPYFGPVLGFIPAFLSALSDSTSKAVLVALSFFIIQELESGIIAPKILENTMGIHPIFVIIALILGGKFYGAWGLILSVPVFAIIKVTYNYIVNKLY
ncbi:MULTISPECIES: AI-2E family transporter [unclassified Caloramator]|uniref:AI-2E family transporter n=1 Tax=unclassified Caloramator TaxID=2629145 RepID=UPI00237E23FA|nr:MULTISPECIES: AI-2E family transporter [unclassified Caloramator]MDO6354345.1 AI-2E family transporter [Caloramator sp. CAR-1]WDU84309.1 AI-2E family transporter [Caloramator sp. Dgby_cultured_2]